MRGNMAKHGYRKRHLCAWVLLAGALVAWVLTQPATAAIATQTQSSSTTLRVSLTIGPVSGACRVDTIAPDTGDAVHCDYATPYRHSMGSAPEETPPPALIQHHATDPFGSDASPEAVYFTIQY